MMVLLTSEWPTASVNQQTDGRGLRLPTHSPTFRGGSSTEDLERPVRDYSYVSKGSRASSPVQLPVKAGAEAHQTANTKLEGVEAWASTLLSSKPSLNVKYRYIAPIKFWRVPGVASTFCPSSPSNSHFSPSTYPTLPSSSPGNLLMSSCGVAFRVPVG